MTAATLARVPAAGASAEFPHVLDGVVLDGAAARLAGMLDRALLDEAGWDPGKRMGVARLKGPLAWRFA